MSRHKRPRRMRTPGNGRPIREQIDATADLLALDLLDQREQDGGGVMYLIPYGDEFEAARAFARELLATLADRGRIIEAELIHERRGLGLLMRDVTPMIDAPE